MSIDLHIHSVFSDGTCTPAEIAALAKERCLKVISITDHDTISGTEEAIMEAQKIGIKAISGIELSVKHDNLNLHILGYLFDYKNERFNRKISVLQMARRQRNEKILIRLQSLGVKIGLGDVKKISKVGQIGRPHIAKVLCNKGVVRNMNEAFGKYLGKGQKAYVPRFVYSAAEAIEIIKTSGGMAVLAHPCQTNSTMSDISRVIDALVKIGLDGLEVYYPTHSKKIRKKLKKIAHKYDLVMSGGSDYHGSIRPGTNLAGGVNVNVPLEIFENMKQKWLG